MSLGLSFVHSFSVLTPFLMLMRGLLDTCLICLFQNNHFNQSGHFRKMGVIWNGVVPALSDFFGSSQTWLFQTWLFAISTRKRSFALFCALLRSFAPFCALLRSFADLRLRSFALICALLRAFACFCERPRIERPRLGTADFYL